MTTTRHRVVVNGVRRRVSRNDQFLRVANSQEEGPDQARPAGASCPQAHRLFVVGRRHQEFDRFPVLVLDPSVVPPVRRVPVRSGRSAPEVLGPLAGRYGGFRLPVGGGRPVPGHRHGVGGPTAFAPDPVRAGFDDAGVRAGPTGSPFRPHWSQVSPPKFSAAAAAPRSNGAGSRISTVRMPSTTAEAVTRGRPVLRLSSFSMRFCSVSISPVQPGRSSGTGRFPSVMA